MGKFNNPVARGTCYFLIYLTGIYPLNSAVAGGIIPDNAKTQIHNNGNVPVVNIAAPNNAGISHNTYKEFNTGTQGAVLNNATQAVNSQLAGQISANANLQGKAAELIINEVTGSSRSELMGQLEVAGQKANVMIANPNGITCDGCGFINTSGAILTTGKPQFDTQGALEALKVTKGQITIGGKGLNGQSTDYVDIISRVTELNGKIQAKNLALTQGANQISFKEGTTKAIAGEGAVPQLAVDTKALGGMYANKIRLIATENGVGVNLKDITSTRDDITLTANGKISLGNITAKTDVNVGAKEISIEDARQYTPYIQAGRNIVLTGNKVTNKSGVTAGQDMRVFGDTIINIGKEALLQANNNMWLQKNVQGDKSDLIQNRSGTIKTNNGDLVIRANNLYNIRNLYFTSKNGKTTRDSIKYSEIDSLQKEYDETISIYSTDEILGDDDNESIDSYLITLKDEIKDFTRDIEVLENFHPSSITAGGNIYVNSDYLWNINSQINSQKNIFLTGKNFRNIRNITYHSSSYSFIPGFPSSSTETYFIYNSPIVVSDLYRYKSKGIGFYDKNIEWYDWNSATQDKISLEEHRKDKLLDNTIAAKENLVIDFSDELVIEKNVADYDYLAPKESNAISAKNIFLHGTHINISDKINSKTDLNIISDGVIFANNSDISSEKDLSLTAVNGVNFKNSKFKGDNFSLINRTGNIYLTGSDFVSKNAFSIISSADIFLKSVVNDFSYGERIDITHKGSTLNSGGNLTIMTNGSLLFQAAKLIAKGTMNISAQGGYLYAQAMEDISHYETRETKRNWYGRKKTTNRTHHSVTNKVTEFIADGDINILSHDDSTYEASKIETNNNAKLTSTHGKINFKSVKDVSFEHIISKSKGFFIKNRDSGHAAETWVLPSVHIGGKLTIDAANGISADIKTQKGQNLQNVLANLGNTSETAWLKGLAQRQDVHWTEVQDAHDSWDYKSQHLNPVAAAVIAIAVAVVTAGAGVTVAAANSAATAATVSTTTYGAVSAGISSLASTAAVSLINNEGNLSKTLKEMGSSKTVKSTITSMAIGGALAGFDKFLGVEKAANGATNVPLLRNLEWSKVAQRVAGQSVISSSLNTAINGGSFKDNFTMALLANVGNQVNIEGADFIGSNGTALGFSEKAISHAAVSAIAAHIGGGDAKAAAAGAFAARLASVTLAKTFNDPAQILAGGKIIGGIAGAFAANSAQGVNSGANAGEIVLEHNFLKYDLYKLDREIKAAKEKGENTAPIFEKMRKSLAEERDMVKTTCKNSPTICGAAQRELVNEAIGELQGTSALYYDRDVVEFVKTETAKDNAVIDDYISTKGEILEYVFNGAEILVGNETKFSVKGKGTNSAHNQQVAQSGPSPTVIVVKTNSGTKGNWNKELNKPQPNTIYHVDGNKTYHTDSLSRPVDIEASLTLSSNDRNYYQQRKTGHQGNPGDDGGHLIGTIFNGPGEKLNMVPMESSLNRHGAWRDMERTWADELKAGKTVNVKIKPTYSSDSLRPDKFTVSYSVDNGRVVERVFKNTSDGK
ncbi:DUF637 domain-containing protein [Xenorhabdus nematophila]|uniref:DUF637 domain-containing protein n=1 Tax=Xenorhabdus nematophila TaxID=628 RepID=UPI000543E3EA|nr:DUF637 domain-containing protein [Xenorhabdus nematophila]CEF30207.1 Putative TpsA-related protein [Xenorhabdus nematophila str. Websteri]AYA39217.1 filamentous hemagglutinin N-terminal domain-containing protein [Xenorhabdus nematophila]MBA0017799.1 DUF637 domain-containing protein [Xenorhabdus nematophila]MCB4426423.1 filamentous hemagglutinin N-terminal domain-containing protein [Xenorhabdus nematophila]QNJ36862.1 DUF637 domain-containing protein [Xenorhabdus nematophila]